MRVVFDMDYPDTVATAVNRRFFFRIHESNFIAVRQVEPDEWNSYSESLRIATFLHACDDLLAASEANYAEFSDTYVQLQGHEPSGDAAQHKAAQLASTLNRRLGNYLSSMRLYLDVTEARLKRVYGPRSEQYAAFRLACVAQFESHLSYRFAYKLRNYAQHLGMPIGHIRVKAVQQDRGGPIEFSSEIAFKTLELLENGGDIWGPVRNDLEQAPELLPVLEIFGSFLHHLRKIRNATLEAERPFLESVRASVTAMLNTLPPARGVRQIGEYVDEGGKLAIEFADSVHEFIGPLTPAPV
jgi:hypothetical protein